MRHTIFESEKYKARGCVPTTIVLVQLSDRDALYDEFVTWMQCWDEQDHSKRAGRVWGHYFHERDYKEGDKSALELATADYWHRVAKNRKG